MQEPEHILEILLKANRAIKENDFSKIKELSNQTIHSASIYQDPDNIAIAVILYAIEKLMERQGSKAIPGWNDFTKKSIKCLQQASIALKRKDLENYREEIGHIESNLNKLPINLKSYIQEIFRKAQINKGSKMYEHGISMEKTAKILGLSIWDLNQYIGQKQFLDLSLTYTQDIKDRLKTAQEIFK